MVRQYDRWSSTSSKYKKVNLRRRIIKKKNLCKHSTIDKLDAKVTSQKMLQKLSENKEKQ